VHITLVRPTMGPLLDGARMEPLGLGVLAGLTPSGVDVRLIDDRCEIIDYDERTDLVAITVETFTARRSYEIADTYRARRVPVVMGGMHATLIPDEVVGHADAVVTGDAETVWTRVVSDAHEHRLRPRYDAPTGPPQLGGVLPRRDLFAGKGYLPITLLQFGRGCRYRCEFCAVGTYFQHRAWTRPVTEVVAEIAAQPRRDLFFVDDNLISDRVAVKELLRALAPLDRRWVSQASVDQVRDAELMDLLVTSGCMGNVIGFESLDPDDLDLMGKRHNLVAFDRYAEAVDVLRAHHLQTWAAFLLGYEHDTPDSILATCSWAIRQHFTFAAFNVLTPYPGTPLYRRLAAEGRLLFDGRWWLHPDYRFNEATFRPRRMSPDQLTDAAWQCRERWSSPASIVRRVVDPATNLHSLERLLLYLTYNPLFRREAFKRQGMRLGLR
jgi:radical SAM superfamily enzyme YgiQ (UPF0313 family)